MPLTIQMIAKLHAQLQQAARAATLGKLERLEDYFGARMAMRIDDKYAAMRLRRRAYICEGGEVKMMHDEGYASITDAFITRPRDCKYCVFEKPEGGAILINMFELMQSGNPMELTVKPNTDVEFPSVDAAIMYALTVE